MYIHIKYFPLCSHDSLGSTNFSLIFFNSFIYFWLHCVFIAVCAGFLWLQLAGATLPYGVRASRWSGFSCWGAQFLEHRLSSCGPRGQLLWGMWDLPGPGIEPMSSALVGRFLSTRPPGKSQFLLNFVLFSIKHLSKWKEKPSSYLSIMLLLQPRVTNHAGLPRDIPVIALQVLSPGKFLISIPIGIVGHPSYLFLCEASYSTCAKSQRIPNSPSKLSLHTCMGRV